VWERGGREKKMHSSLEFFLVLLGEKGKGRMRERENQVVREGGKKRGSHVRKKGGTGSPTWE